MKFIAYAMIGLALLPMLTWAGDDAENPPPKKPDCSSELSKSAKPDSDADSWTLFSWRRPRPVVEGEGSRFRERRTFLEDRRRMEEREREEARRSFEKKKLIDSIQEELRNPEWVPEITSLLNARALKGIRKVKSAALIASPADGQGEADLLSVARSLVKSGYFVLYDADNSFAGKLSGVLAEKGVGISAHLSRQDYSKNIFSIPNDYLRLNTFESAERIAVEGNSALGTALLVNSKVDLVIGGGGDFSNSLARWQDEIADNGRRLGLKFERVAVQSAEDTIGRGFPHRYSFDSEYKPKKIARFRPAPVRLSDLSYDDLKSILAHRKFMTEAQAKLGALGGSVVFGSGQIDRPSVSKNYEIVYSLSAKGAATTSGGAGGAMVVANTAAYDAGGKSIGIPIGGRNQLSSEKRVYNEVQTETVTTTGYEQRIPLLLHGKELVLAVPGGSGTMREVAVTLLKMVAEPQSHFQLILIDKSYYQGFYEWLKQRLPGPVSDRIHLVDGREEFDQLVSELIQSGRLNGDRLFMNPAPAAPRTDRTSYPLERKEDRDSDWGFGDFF